MNGAVSIVEAIEAKKEEAAKEQSGALGEKDTTCETLNT